MTTSRYNFPFLSTAILTLSVLCGACKDDDDGINESQVVIETIDDSHQSDDELRVKTDLKTFVYDYEYDNIGKAFINRITIKQICSTLPCKP